MGGGPPQSTSTRMEMVLFNSKSTNYSLETALQKQPFTFAWDVWFCPVTFNSAKWYVLSLTVIKSHFTVVRDGASRAGAATPHLPSVRRCWGIPAQYLCDKQRNAQGVQTKIPKYIYTTLFLYKNGGRKRLWRFAKQWNLIFDWKQYKDHISTTEANSTFIRIFS